MISNLLNRGSLPALVDTMSFHETRVRVIAENVANLNTPGYAAKQLDAKNFQAAIRKAIEQRDGNPTKPWRLDGGNEVRTDSNGKLRIAPGVRPVENILFHDGTNASIENQMSDLAQTGMMHDLAAQLLRAKFEGLRKAIRGQA